MVNVCMLIALRCIRTVLRTYLPYGTTHVPCHARKEPPACARTVTATAAAAVGPRGG